MAVSKRLRFEVLRRDNHTCRYCGRSAPEVKLTVDHVTPTALGGRGEPANLVTACEPCNSGKSATPPGADLVDEVSQDALRWAQAVAVAAERMLADHDERQETYDEFEATWDAWTYGKDKQPIPRPDDWRQTVDRFMAAGLPLPVVIECATTAMANNKIPAERTFRYMCGIAWQRVSELQASASQLIVGSPEPLADIESPRSRRSSVHWEILALLDQDEREWAVHRAHETPDDQRMYVDDEVEAAYVLAAESRSSVCVLRPAIRALFADLDDTVRARIVDSATTEAEKWLGEDYTRDDLAAHALHFLSREIQPTVGRKMADA